MVPMNFQQCLKAKLKRPHFIKVQSGKITVWNLLCLLKPDTYIPPFEVKSIKMKYILCFYALLIFAVKACPSSKRNDDPIYPMRSDRNQSGMYNQEPLSSLKVSRSRKQIIMSLILSKNEQNTPRILPHCKFFGRIRDFIICFRDLLTFSNLQQA